MSNMDEESPGGTRPGQEKKKKRRGPINLVLNLVALVLICGLLAGVLYLLVSNEVIDLGDLGALGELGGLRNLGDFSDLSLVPDTKLPDPTSNTRAKEVEIFDVWLNWNDNSNNEDGFRIYRRRLDILSSPVLAGESGRDKPEFQDRDTYCGATYQYTIASFNSLGESPTTECWQITLGPCPTVRVMRLAFGSESGRNFATGALGATADFYAASTEKGLLFMADGDGQQGLVDLGNVGETPLHHVDLLPDTKFRRDGIPALPGHTYVARMRDGRGLIIFTLSQLDNPMTLEYIIYYPADQIEAFACVRFGGLTPGGPCVSGDGVCDPTCVPADPAKRDKPVPPEDRKKKDEFEQYYEVTVAANPGGDEILKISWDPAIQQEGPTGPGSGGKNNVGSTPPLPGYPESTYTEKDFDCGNQPCISGDDICSPDCATSENYRDWNNAQTCESGGPNYGTAGTPPLCDPPPGGDTQSPNTGALALMVSTPNRTGNFTDTDCDDDPCVTGDGICDPACVPNTNDTTRSGLAMVASIDCSDPDNNSDPDLCGERGKGERDQPMGTPPPGTSRVDGDCGGPCTSGDGRCTPYCDPYYDPNQNYGGTSSNIPMGSLYDPECGNPCPPGNNNCNCTPTTATLAYFPQTCQPVPGQDEQCACRGADLYCNGQLSEANSTQCSSTDCVCEGADLYCGGQLSEANSVLCRSTCICKGPDLYCGDQLSETNSSKCQTGGGCGDGYCDTATENSDLCPEDCQCVDDGTCAPGEGAGCRDCGETAGGCGNPCTDDTQCAEGLSCVGVCWHACTCGGDCGSEGGGDTERKCSCDGPHMYCDDGTVIKNHPKCGYPSYPMRLTPGDKLPPEILALLRLLITGSTGVGAATVLSLAALERRGGRRND